MFESDSVDKIMAVRVIPPQLGGRSKWRLVLKCQEIEILENLFTLMPYRLLSCQYSLDYGNIKILAASKQQILKTLRCDFSVI